MFLLFLLLGGTALHLNFFFFSESCKEAERNFLPSLEAYFEDAIMEIDPKNKVSRQGRTSHFIRGQLVGGGNLLLAVFCCILRRYRRGRRGKGSAFRLGVGVLGRVGRGEPSHLKAL